MSSTNETYADFIASDTAFLADMEIASKLDPLWLIDDDLLPEFQQRERLPDDDIVEDIIDRFDAWHSEKPNFTELTAARRDVDKIFGCYAAQKYDPFDVHSDLKQIAGYFLKNSGVTARADIYDYTLAAPTNLSGTYTNDEREVAFIDILAASFRAGHSALSNTLMARHALEHEGSSAAAAYLEETLLVVGEISKPMQRIHREVGPGFVAKEQTRYLVDINYEGHRYEGPNASHGAFLALDRFVLGSFTYFQDNRDIQAQIEYRMSDMRPHITSLVARADSLGDNQSLVELSAPHSELVRQLANSITQKIRKFKIMHKSYADKALASKGKVLSPDDPDLLSSLIVFARNAEAK